MKKLSWFKDRTEDWLCGDIQYCDDASRLFYIDLKHWYWLNNCNLSVKDVRKRCKFRAEKLHKCVKVLQDCDLIIVNDDNFSIPDLDEQYAQIVATSELNSKNGKLGGAATAKRALSDRIAILDKDKDKDKDKKKPKKPLKDSVAYLIGKAKCKYQKTINHGNWEALIDQYGIEVITEASKQIPATKRWPDQIEVICDKLTRKKADDTTLSENELREAFSPHIEFRDSKMVETISELRFIISKSSLEQTISAAEKMAESEGKKIWSSQLIAKFRETQCL